MTTDRQNKARELYANLMFESRMRIDAINFILAGQTRLAEGIVNELSYLQLRMLCETIALGCLVAHGDIVERRIKDFEKEWSPNNIFKRLASLNEHFFQQQAEFSNSNGMFNINANTKPNALKKDELVTLWNKCGDFLHRGTLKKIQRADPHTHGRINVTEIVGWAQKIEDLLGAHIIPLEAGPEKSVILMCYLRDTTQNLGTTVQRIELERAKPPSL